MRNNTNRNRYVAKNNSAKIVVRTDRRGQTRTETQGRDNDSMLVAAVTNNKNSTRFFIDIPTGLTFEGKPEYDTVEFTGAEARTIYRVLQKHYGSTERF